MHSCQREEPALTEADLCNWRRCRADRSAPSIQSFSPLFSTRAHRGVFPAASLSGSHQNSARPPFSPEPRDTSPRWLKPSPSLAQQLAASGIWRTGGPRQFGNGIEINNIYQRNIPFHRYPRVFRDQHIYIYMVCINICIVYIYI